MCLLFPEIEMNVLRQCSVVIVFMFTEYTSSKPLFAHSKERLFLLKSVEEDLLCYFYAPSHLVCCWTSLLFISHQEQLSITFSSPSVTSLLVAISKILYSVSHLEKKQAVTAFTSLVCDKSSQLDAEKHSAHFWSLAKFVYIYPFPRYST